MSKTVKQKSTKKRPKPTPKSQKVTKESPQELSQQPPEKLAQVIDLDEGTLEIEDVAPDFPTGPEKVDLGWRLHVLNVRLPWLKILLLTLLAGSVALGVEELLRHNVSQPVGQVAEVEDTADTGEPAETEPAVGEPETDQPVSQPETQEPTFPAKTEKETPATQPTTPVQPTTSETMGCKIVALTFDDGPSATQTPRLLRILREKNVKATFFVLGNLAQRSPDIVRQEEAEGHEVGSHTMTHANLNRSTVEGIQWEIAAVDNVFLDVLGHKSALMRPPYGNINGSVRTYAHQPLILWTVDPEDWKYRDAAVVRRNVVYNAFNGAIILMHDTHATTVDAVAGIIDDLRAAGYEFMTVSELAAARGIVLQNGVTYGSFRP